MMQRSGGHTPALNLNFTNDAELEASFAVYEQITKKYFNDAPSITNGRNKNRNKDYFCELAGYSGGYQQFVSTKAPSIGNQLDQDTNASTNKPQTEEDIISGLMQDLPIVISDDFASADDLVSYIISSWRNYVIQYHREDDYLSHMHADTLKRWLVTLPDFESSVGTSVIFDTPVVDEETAERETHAFGQKYTSMLKQIRTLAHHLDVILISPYFMEDFIDDEGNYKEVYDAFIDLLEYGYSDLYQIITKLPKEEIQGLFERVIGHPLAKDKLFNKEMMVLTGDDIIFLQDELFARYAKWVSPVEFEANGALIVDYYYQEFKFILSSDTNYFSTHEFDGEEFEAELYMALTQLMIGTPMESLTEDAFENEIIEKFDDIMFHLKQPKTNWVFRAHEGLFREFANAKDVHSFLDDMIESISDDSTLTRGRTFISMFDVAQHLINNGLDPKHLKSEELRDYFAQG